MAAKNVAIPLALCSRFAHAHYGSELSDRFLYWGDHRNHRIYLLNGYDF